MNAALIPAMQAARLSRWTIATLLLAPLPAATAPAPGLTTGIEGPLLYEDEAVRPPAYGLRMGILVSDNINRAADDSGDEIEETVGVGELLADWRRLGPRLDLSFSGNVSYRHYTDDTFDDETRANLLAGLNLTLLPETLDWYVTDRLANAPIDPLATATPVNIQYVNVLETGPRLTLRPGESNELTVMAARAKINAEESPIDHDRESATARFRRNFSLTTTASLVASASSLEFDPDAVAEDFDQKQAYLDFNSRTETMNLEAAAGVSRTQLTSGLERETGIGWFRAGVQRTSDSRVYLGVERRTGDTAALLDAETLTRDSLPSVAVVGDPYIVNSAALRYTRGWDAHEWALTAIGRRLDYLVSPLDQEHRGAQFATRFMLSSRLLLEATAASNDIEYRDIVRSDTLRELRVEVDYRIDRSWSLIAGLRHLRRDSTDPAQRFRENFLTLFLSYAPRGRRPLGAY